jgi:predicted AlkP superfamily pyrophosphatase or phosphodiesterase
MRWFFRLAAALCLLAPVAIQAAPAKRTPVTILVSIDGFRPDYLDRGVTPVLNKLGATGVRAVMHPSFPSKTYPNHWTLVTGLTPDHNGIVANRMEDMANPKNVFTMSTDDPAWWNGRASPIWVDAEKAGIRTATMFWPGANVAFGGTRDKEWPNTVRGGTRPADFWTYYGDIPPEQRVRGIIDWLRRPAATRPKLMTLYFQSVDDAGHLYGPDDPRTTQAVADADKVIGLLVALKAIGQPANLVIVADHGMAGTSSERTIAMDTIVPRELVHYVETGPYAALWALPGKEAEVDKLLLGSHPHLQCWRKAEIPARFGYGTNPRIPPYFCLAEVGWLTAETAPKKPETGGNHGYDNMAPEMAALFVANGPAFAGGKRLPDFNNVDVEPLLRRLIGLPHEAGLDGSDKVFEGVLKR